MRKALGTTRTVLLLGSMSLVYVQFVKVKMLPFDNKSEFQVIIDTLRSERGRRKEAAERLGISPRTLRYKLAQMRDAGMDVEAYLYAS